MKTMKPLVKIEEQIIVVSGNTKFAFLELAKETLSS